MYFPTSRLLCLVIAITASKFLFNLGTHSADGKQELVPAPVALISPSSTTEAAAEEPMTEPTQMGAVYEPSAPAASAAEVVAPGLLVAPTAPAEPTIVPAALGPTPILRGSDEQHAKFQAPLTQGQMGQPTLTQPSVDQPSFAPHWLEQPILEQPALSYPLSEQPWPAHPSEEFAPNATSVEPGLEIVEFAPHLQRGGFDTRIAADRL